MNLDVANLCQDCNWVGSDRQRCEKCQSGSLLPLAPILNRQSTRFVEIECAEGKVRITVQ